VRASAKAKDHFGLGRETTEDVFRIHEDLGLYLVCDGSRDTDGRWAAETICDVVYRELKKSQDVLSQYKSAPSKAGRSAVERSLTAAIEKAASEIFKACFIDKKRKASASALGAMLFLGDYALSAHVGNTRLYLVRAGKPLRLTRDHTYYEEMLRQAPGGQVNPVFKKRLTRAIGDSESVPLAVISIPLMPEDLLVLCSNGVSDHLAEDGEDLRALATSGDPNTLHTRLVEWALSRKSDDNITALVVRITPEPGATSAAIPVQRDARKQIDLLRSLKILSGIRDDERALLKLQGILTFRKAQAGDVIVQQGSPSDEMFVVLSGKTEVRADGKAVAARGPGEVIGEMGFFDGRLRSATVVAVQSTELMSIQRWEFDALVQQDWRMGYRILEAVVVALAGKLEESTSARSAGKS
jgi:serine/threonine protein phosphatase PrpC/CRP-like cAMP-binding protein